ncbi:helix-turn-helix domain-containing protein [Actinoplanes sp. DH11]|uniref:helix-turn-helix domain-containing protein n=1 Tax=Actinoplanes sp. DH11 TaxID=2857011 RepID=UPI001E4B5D3F|nr:helix-turn-helix domain-containing protein [Actinoplanes sp. DH11]
MGLRFLNRASDLAWVDTVWTCTAGRVTEMTSVATPCWGLVFWEQDGATHAAVTGPETRTGTAPVPAGAVFTGIEFAVGTSLRALPATALVDSGAVLPGATSRRFRLAGTHWETPGADDAEALVARLVADGVVVRDPLVAELRHGRPGTVSPRTAERRFRAATGLTQGAVRQIERARSAALLLGAGATTAEAVDRLDYFDEPHLARALQRYVGRTARQLRDGAGGAIALDTSRPVAATH